MLENIPAMNKVSEATCAFWVTISLSSAWGTALADYLADNSGLGFLGGASLTGGVVAITALLYKFTPSAASHCFGLHLY